MAKTEAITMRRQADAAYVPLLRVVWLVIKLR